MRYKTYYCHPERSEACLTGRQESMQTTWPLPSFIIDASFISITSCFLKK